ncbi:MAG: TonB-dependent receptor plug domain-containing protein [Bacteroidota bacterium]
MRKSFLIVLLFFACSLSAQEQVEFDDLPLSDALKEVEEIYSIRFAFNPDKIEKTNISIDGSYDLNSILEEIKAKSSLSFYFLDYENILIKQGDQIELPVDTIQLGTIEIVAEYLTSGFDMNKQEAAFNLDPQDLGVLPGLLEPDVFQSLQLIPGISSPSESAANLNIRGGTPDQNLILFDNIPIYHLGHLFGNITSLNPYVIDDVKVYKSGTNAKYGGRISGVIDMKMDDDIPNATQFGIGMNPMHSDVFLKSSAKNKFGYVLSARRSLTDVFESSTYVNFSNKVFQNTRISEIGDVSAEEEDLEVLDNVLFFSDINAKLLYRPSESQMISLTGIRLENNLDFSNQDVELVSSDFLRLSNNGASLNWKNQMNSRNELTARVHFSEYNSTYNFSETEDGLLVENLERINAVLDRGLSATWEHNKSTNTSWRLGYDFSHLEVNLDINLSGENVSQENTEGIEYSHAAYVDFSFKNEHLLINPGLRLNRFVNLGQFNVEPRFYGEYKFSDFFKLKLSAESKNQIISQLISFEFNELGIDNAIWVMADNEDLSVLNNQQVTAGFVWSKSNWLIDIEAYSRRITGLSSFTKGFLSNNENVFEQGTSSSRGMDLLLKRKFKKYRVWLAYTYAITDFQFEAFDDVRFPGNNDQRHYLNISNSYKWRAFQLSLGWTFSSGLPFSEEPEIIDLGDDDQELLFNEQNNLRMDNYHRLDASLVWNFKLGVKQNVKGRLGLAFMNIYNRSNEIETIYNTDDNEDEELFVITETIIGLKRTPNFVFRMWF